MMRLQILTPFLFQSAPASLRRENMVRYRRGPISPQFQSAPASLRRENYLRQYLPNITSSVSIRSRLFEAGEHIINAQ